MTRAPGPGRRAVWSARCDRRKPGGRARPRSGPLQFALALLMGIPASASTDLHDLVGRARAGGCGGRPGISAPLVSRADLDDAARRLSRGERLTEALAGVGYRALRSESLQLRGASDEAMLMRALKGSFCDALVDPGLREIGIAQRGTEAWIVLAAPFSPPTPADAAAVAHEMLRLVNGARAAARHCGASRFSAAPPLKLDARLTQAALGHARAMARRDVLTHEGADGSTPAQRASLAGYRWSVVAENVAAGAPSADETFRSWLESPSHCANLMSSRHTEMGLAYAVNRRSKAGIYWAQLFAAPRR